MAVEQARIHIEPKPWGSPDLRPWHAYHDDKAAIGEIWFERTDLPVRTGDGPEARSVIRTPPAKTAP